MANATVTVNVENLEVIKEMRNEIAELKAKVAHMERVPGINFIARDEKLSRDVIIEMAKRDIEELKRGGYYDVADPKSAYPWRCNAEFHVNNEKRTVVALMKGFEGPILFSKGIAKCAPSDCFNSHIGKAIALRRALGLDVPQEYLNAPKPEEVRVGDVILRKGDFQETNGKRTVTKINDLGNGEKSYNTKERSAVTSEECVVKIIDDSREEVSE